MHDEELSTQNTEGWTEDHFKRLIGSPLEGWRNSDNGRTKILKKSVIDFKNNLKVKEEIIVLIQSYRHKYKYLKITYLILHCTT